MYKKLNFSSLTAHNYFFLLLDGVRKPRQLNSIVYRNLQSLVAG